MFEHFVRFVREIYDTQADIPLHQPYFGGREKEYLLDTIDSTFVSSVGAYVSSFEERVAEYTGSAYAIATASGTSGLHAALMVSGVGVDDEVITQPLTFAATCAAIKYCGAHPVFVDIDRNTLGMSPESLHLFLEEHTENVGEFCRNTITGRWIKCCLPMHTFGHPVRIQEIIEICSAHNIQVIEDSAESLGSFSHDKHTGTFGRAGVLSFNGNKIITTGGGGMILTDDSDFAASVRHLTTTAKVQHAWEFQHDMVGYNYRMPNVNAALGVAQLEQLESFRLSKRSLAACYREWCNLRGLECIIEPSGTESNYWLNAIMLADKSERDDFLAYTNSHGVMTRPAWALMHTLPMYSNCIRTKLTVSEDVAARIVNIPSSVVKHDI
jgi:aminotransferase in exopolysaccharide biosynthesis